MADEANTSKSTPPSADTFSGAGFQRRGRQSSDSAAAVAGGAVAGTRASSDRPSSSKTPSGRLAEKIQRDSRIAAGEDEGDEGIIPTGAGLKEDARRGDSDSKVVATKPGARGSGGEEEVKEEVSPASQKARLASRRPRKGKKEKDLSNTGNTGGSHRGEPAAGAQKSEARWQRKLAGAERLRRGKDESTGNAEMLTADPVARGTNDGDDFSDNHGGVTAASDFDHMPTVSLRPGAFYVPGTGDERPTRTGALSQSTPTQSGTAPPVLEARLVTEDHEPPHSSADVPVVAEAQRLTCGINFRDRKVQICLGLAMLAFVALAIGLGVSLRNNAEKQSAGVGAFSASEPTTAPPTSPPSHSPTAPPTFPPSDSPTGLSWEQSGSDINGQENFYNCGVPFSDGIGASGLFGSAVALSKDGDFLAAGFGESQEFYFRRLGAVSHRFIVIVYTRGVYEGGESSWPSLKPTSSARPWEEIAKIEPVDIQMWRSPTKDISVCLSHDGLMLAVACNGLVEIFSTTIASEASYPYGDYSASYYEARFGQAIEMGTYPAMSLSALNNIVAIAKTNSFGVYEYSVNVGDWVQLGQNMTVHENEIAKSVSLSEDGYFVAVGADILKNVNLEPDTCPYVNLMEELEYAGYKVRMFKYTEVSKGWVQVGSVIDGEAAESLFTDKSISISADGKVVAIGGSIRDLPRCGPVYGVRKDTGRVRVFRLSADAWVPMGNPLYGEEVGDMFGVSVSLSDDGNVLAVGASGSNANGLDSGKTSVYKFDGSDWDLIGKDVLGDTGDNSGRSVSLSSDSLSIAVGAPRNSAFGVDTGTVRTYDLLGV